LKNGGRKLKADGIAGGGSFLNRGRRGGNKRYARSEYKGKNASARSGQGGDIWKEGRTRSP